MLDHKAERESDVKKICDSVHPKKIVVAGPGTGKSHLFKELLKKKHSDGSRNFLAVTFIGKLGNALAMDLCGLAKTTTMHSYAREFVLENCPKKWVYYPRIHEIIAKDLKSEGIQNITVADENYKKKSIYYKAVGDADVIHYAVQICKKDDNKIPKFDLILIDEYQDFNSIESEFVDLLAKSPIVIVGDDDQALYAFKGSSASFIREKYCNPQYEAHTLRFCSRCTKVIIDYFDNLVGKYKLNEPPSQRIKKQYLCYTPDKKHDSELNPKINLIKNCPTGMIASKIHKELKVLASNQSIKDVLVIGEAQSCGAILKAIASQLRNIGYRNVDYRDENTAKIKQDVVDAYRFISQDENSLLGWRILENPTDRVLRKAHLRNATTLKTIISGNPSKVAGISQSRISELESAICEVREDSDIRRHILVNELKERNVFLSRPLCNVEVTVCSILGSKGLGADIVFLVGFDQGKFPQKVNATDSEIYQMLVAITRAKKRVYMVNTVRRPVSSFVDCLHADYLDVETVEMKAKKKAGTVEKANGE
jgi:superfamily I DNA/RNA helicase